MSHTSTELVRRLDADLLRRPLTSRLVKLQVSRPDINVSVCEIRQHDTPATFGAQPNPPIYVYETAAAFMDTDHPPDPVRGLPTLRQGWIQSARESITTRPNIRKHTRPHISASCADLNSVR